MGKINIPPGIVGDLNEDGYHDEVAAVPDPDIERRERTVEDLKNSFEENKQKALERAEKIAEGKRLAQETRLAHSQMQTPGAVSPERKLSKDDIKNIIREQVKSGEIDLKGTPAEGLIPQDETYTGVSDEEQARRTKEFQKLIVESII